MVLIDPPDARRAMIPAATLMMFHTTVTIVRAEVSASKRATKGVPHSS
jgi:hypothetical protein